jgi:hypothetical protein
MRREIIKKKDYQRKTWQSNQNVIKLFRNRIFSLTFIVCIVLVSGCSLWGASSANHSTSRLHIGTNLTTLPPGMPGTVIVQSGSSVWLLHSGKSSPIQILGGQYISISPDGSLLLVDGQQFISTSSGKNIGNVRAVTPLAQLPESLWLTSQEVVLGSYQSAGLYSVGLTSTTTEVLSTQCSLGVYSPQAVNSNAKALLCLMDNGSIGILYYENSPASLVPITIHPSTQSQVEYVTYPIWSPDGQHIVFVWGTSTGSTPPTASTIAMANLDGTGFTTLTPTAPGTFYTLPSWSPDGKQLAYVQETLARNAPSRSTFTIHLLTLATHHDQVIARGTGSGPSNLIWSPGGNYLAYDDILGPNQPGNVTLVQVSNGRQYLIASKMTLVGWAA